jgi:hypothetical protein
MLPDSGICSSREQIGLSVELNNRVRDSAVVAKGISPGCCLIENDIDNG